MGSNHQEKTSPAYARGTRTCNSCVCCPALIGSPLFQYIYIYICIYLNGPLYQSQMKPTGRGRNCFENSLKPLIAFLSLTADLEQDRASKFGKFCFFFSLSALKFKECRKAKQKKPYSKKDKSGFEAGSYTSEKPG